MKKLIILILFITQLTAQGLCPFIGPDLQLPCGITNTTLIADFINCPAGGPNPLATNNYALANIPFAPVSNAGTNIVLGDDQVLGPYPIGFSFCFFGNTYTNFWIGSNGWISFTTGQSASWSCSTIPIPTTNACVPKNCIMMPYFDWYPPGGGTIRYQTLGVAPCRTLVISYNAIQQFSCWAQVGTFQTILYESTNVIENHITNKPNCPGWNSGGGVQGIHNLAGTVAVTVPGRNGSAWTTNNNAYRYTPAGAPIAPTYNWYQVGNPVSIGSGLTLNVTPPAGGASYTCHVDYGACYSGYMQCMGFIGASGPDTINVIPGPPNIFPIIQPPLDFCPGTSITVGTTLPYISYLWQDGSTNPVYTTNTPGPISVTVTDINGCIGTANAILNQWPNLVLNIIPSNPIICLGNNITMTATGALNYVWTPSSGLNNNNTANVIATPTATTTYVVVGTDINGCVDSIPITVIVNPLPIVTAIASSPGVCSGFSTQLTASGALNYVWTPNATLSNPNTSITTATPTTSTNYQVIGTDANGCVDTAYVNVGVYDMPNSLFSSGSNGCAPFTFTALDNSTIFSGNITNWYWTIDGQMSNTLNPTFTIANPGSYSLTLITTSNYGCLDTTVTLNYVNVYSNPTAGFTFLPTTANMLNPIVYFTNTSSLDAVNFLWDFDGTGSSTFANPSFEFIYPDTFNVCLMVATINGCVDTACNSIEVVDLSILYIPNAFTPGGNNINESWFPVGRNLSNGQTTISVKVYDRWGEEVFSSNTSSKPWDGKYKGVNCKQDVYTYRVFFKNEKGKEFTYIGYVTLLR